MLEGRYPDSYLQNTGKDAPEIQDDDLKIISSSGDFVGINVYRPISYVIASEDASGCYTPGWRPGYRKPVAYGLENIK